MPDPTQQLARWTVVTAAASRPLTWAEAKAHLRLDSDDEQTYVEGLIEAVADYAEDRLACSLMARTLLATFYDGEPLILPRGPLIEVTGIVDRDEAAVTDYELRHAGHAAEVVLSAGGAGYPYSVTYRAGYASAATIPAGIRSVLLLHVATLYENRESVSEKGRTPVPHSLDAFYSLKARKVCVG